MTDREKELERLLRHVADDWRDGGWLSEDLYSAIRTSLASSPAQEEKRWTLAEMKERFYAAREPGAWDWCRWDDFEASLVRGASWMDTYSDLKETP